MTELWATLRDAKVATALAFGLTSLGGFLLLFVGWRGAAATAFVPFQVPYLVSGGIIGLALVGTGLALLNTHVDRVEAALEHEEFEQLQRGAMRLLTSVTAERRGR